MLLGYPAEKRGARTTKEASREGFRCTLSLKSLNVETSFFRGEPLPAAAPPAVEVTAGERPTAAKDALAMSAFACSQILCWRAV